jgi:hypothetical protein
VPSGPLEIRLKKSCLSQFCYFFLIFFEFIILFRILCDFSLCFQILILLLIRGRVSSLFKEFVNLFERQTLLNLFSKNKVVNLELISAILFTQKKSIFCDCLLSF